MEKIFELITTVAGSFGGSAVITAGVIWFVFWAYGKFVKMTAKHESLEKCCSDLNGRVTSVEKSVNEIRGDMQYVKSTLNTLMNMVQNSGQSIMQSHSPLSLTEFGERMASEMGVDSILSRNFAGIKAKIDADVVVKTPYDVQTYCLEKIPVFPEVYLTAEDLSSVKAYAFNNGRTLFECLKIVGLKARDAYFKATGMTGD